MSEEIKHNCADGKCNCDGPVFMPAVDALTDYFKKLREQVEKELKEKEKKNDTREN